ncbi:YciI family protein [Paradevosia shaoguanensis]|uniref:YciI family protein n=1 Tax=Paradevosia shaoguanensis TaxID=1335043 RepID=A0AA41UFQ3_9HYPH|nr:YciI family protein [Paradevosia shaoguanensis]MCF1742158.1 YciI family protein [Paradevosia shaoguanensis]MCI0126641.1 YciI family protein [Paradevosia shaoguanensis]
MQYMLLVHWNEPENTAASDERKTESFAAYTAYAEALRQAGALVTSAGLQPSTTSTIVRAPDGRPALWDGPYVESKEQLGGYFVIDVPDLDAAIAWAVRCPGAERYAVEIRPLMVY